MFSGFYNPRKANQSQDTSQSSTNRTQQQHQQDQSVNTATNPSISNQTHNNKPISSSQVPYTKQNYPNFTDQHSNSSRNSSLSSLQHAQPVLRPQHSGQSGLFPTPKSNRQLITSSSASEQNTLKNHAVSLTIPDDTDIPFIHRPKQRAVISLRNLTPEKRSQMRSRFFAAIEAGDRNAVFQMYQLTHLLYGESFDLINSPNDQGIVALLLAASTGRYPLVRLLVELGAVVTTCDYRGWNSLFYACFQGHISIAIYLLSLQPSLASTDIYGRTLLMIGASRGHLSIVQLCIMAGISVNATTSQTGETALFFACKGGHLSVVSYLIQCGASIDIIDQRLCTPLMYALRIRRYDIGELLIAYGACIDLVDTSGRDITHFTAQQEAQIRHDIGKDLDDIHYNDEYTHTCFLQQLNTHRVNVLKAIQNGTDRHHIIMNTISLQYTQTTLQNNILQAIHAIAMDITSSPLVQTQSMDTTASTTSITTTHTNNTTNNKPHVTPNHNDQLNYLSNLGTQHTHNKDHSKNSKTSSHHRQHLINTLAQQSTPKHTTTTTATSTATQSTESATNQSPAKSRRSKQGQRRPSYSSAYPIQSTSVPAPAQPVFTPLDSTSLSQHGGGGGDDVDDVETSAITRPPPITQAPSTPMSPTSIEPNIATGGGHSQKKSHKHSSSSSSNNQQQPSQQHNILQSSQYLDYGLDMADNEPLIIQRGTVKQSSHHASHNKTSSRK